MREVGAPAGPPSAGANAAAAPRTTTGPGAGSGPPSPAPGTVVVLAASAAAHADFLNSTIADLEHNTTTEVELRGSNSASPASSPTESDEEGWLYRYCGKPLTETLSGWM